MLILQHRSMSEFDNCGAFVSEIKSLRYTLLAGDDYIESSMTYFSS